MNSKVYTRINEIKNNRVNSGDKTDKQQIFIIGSKGIPANYGGFETFVEKLTEYQISKHLQYHVSCLSDNNTHFLYNRAECFNIKVPSIGAAKAVYYDIAALYACITYCKARPFIKHPVFYILACRIGPFIRYFKNEIKKLDGLLYINPDGHEWKRSKWNFLIRQYWKWSEKLMVINANLIICDSKNIEKYIKETYASYYPLTTFIAYGADMTPSVLQDSSLKYINWLKKNHLSSNEYYLIVGRFVPENNFEIIIKEFLSSLSKKDLVFITTENSTLYKKLERKLHFEKDKRIKFVGTTYDKELLKKIRENAYAYIHGHEVGGTNPSLLEALSFTKLNLLLDVGFNKEVGKDAALYWNKGLGNLSNLIDYCDSMPSEQILELASKAHDRVSQKYNWEKIINSYETLFLNSNQLLKGQTET